MNLFSICNFLLRILNFFCFALDKKVYIVYYVYNVYIQFRRLKNGYYYQQFIRETYL